MIVQHNIAALNSFRQLGGNNNALSKNLEKLASGYKVNRAGDDAAGLAISEKMRAQIRGLETAQRNSLDGISLIQTAEGALTEVHSMLNRMVDLTTQASNGIYGPNERTNIQEELKSLLDEIDRIAKNTDFNGTTLLNGHLDTKSLTLQVGDTGVQIITVKIANMQTSALTINAIKVDTVADANKAMTSVRDAITAVSTVRAKLGALQNRLEHTISNLGVTTENITAAESRIRDTDMAKEMMSYTKNNILTQSAQAMLAQANQVPQGILQLLR